MDAGKPKKQALAISYNMQRRSGKKKMAQGGQVNAKYEKRPMPSETDEDSKMVSRNSSIKKPGEDSWSDNPTVRDAQSPSPHKLSQPKLVGSDEFSSRNKQMRDEENDLGDSIHPETDRAQPNKRDDEIGPNRQGPKVSDMERQHGNKRAAYEMSKENQYSEDVADANMKKIQSPPGRYAQGGPVMEPEDEGMELMERSDEGNMQGRLSPGRHGEQPKGQYDEIEAPHSAGPLDMERQHNNGRPAYAKGGEIEDHYESIADAILAKKRKSKMMAEGGQVDLSRNADEDLNFEDQQSFKAGRKENYSESEGLAQLDSPMDSNEHSPEHEEMDVNDKDIVESIRRKKRAKL